MKEKRNGVRVGGVAIQSLIHLNPSFGSALLAACCVHQDGEHRNSFIQASWSNRPGTTYADISAMCLWANLLYACRTDCAPEKHHRTSTNCSHFIVVSFFSFFFRSFIARQQKCGQTVIYFYVLYENGAFFFLSYISSSFSHFYSAWRRMYAVSIHSYVIWAL